jgi:hypothetical protein
LKGDNDCGVVEEGGGPELEMGAAMVDWVQRGDDAMPVMAAGLLRMEVGVEAGTVGRLGQAGRDAMWARRWCWFGLAGRQRPESG